MVDMAQRLGASLQVGESIVGQMHQQKSQHRSAPQSDSLTDAQKTDLVAS